MILSTLQSLNRREKLFILAFIIAIFLSFFLLTGYIWVKTDKTSSSIYTPSQPTENWKTVISREHNFSFSYPDSLTLHVASRTDKSWSFDFNGNTALDITVTNLTIEDARKKYPSINFAKTNGKIFYADIIPEDKSFQRRLYIVKLEENKYIWILAYISAFDLPTQEIQQILNTLLNSITRL